MVDYLQILRSLDKQDRIGEDGVFKLLTTGRRDSSGAFTPGCGLTDSHAVFILGMNRCTSAAFNPDKKEDVLIYNRFMLMMILEESLVDEETGKTAWDYLLDQVEKIENPNIGWILDDLVEQIPNWPEPNTKDVRLLMSYREKSE